MTIGTRIYTLINGSLVGEDEFGNRYYESRKKSISNKPKRWVMYKGKHEPSKVPPNWHGWLHYTTDHVPHEKYKWQTDHAPNLTGTLDAYTPPGHLSRGKNRKESSSVVEPWNPNI